MTQSRRLESTTWALGNHKWTKSRGILYKRAKVIQKYQQKRIYFPKQTKKHNKHNFHCHESLKSHKFLYFYITYAYKYNQMINETNSACLLFYSIIFGGIYHRGGFMGGGHSTLFSTLYYFSFILCLEKTFYSDCLDIVVSLCEACLCRRIN